MKIKLVTEIKDNKYWIDKGYIDDDGLYYIPISLSGFFKEMYSDFAVEDLIPKHTPLMSPPKKKKKNGIKSKK